MNKQQGFSIIEFLIGMAASLVVSASVISVYLSILNSNTISIKTARLDHDLRTAMALMATDIRRAGYWSNASSNIGVNANNNPFASATTAIQVTGSSDCILFAYDKNNTGILPALNNAGGDNRFGFRLVNETLQARPDVSATFSCDDSEASWDKITDPPSISISNLSITLSPSVVTVPGTTHTMTVNNVAISITGHLTEDTSVSRTLTETIRVRNDIYTP